MSADMSAMDRRDFLFIRKESKDLHRFFLIRVFKIANKFDVLKDIFRERIARLARTSF